MKPNLSIIAMPIAVTVGATYIEDGRVPANRGGSRATVVDNSCRRQQDFGDVLFGWSMSPLERSRG